MCLADFLFQDKTAVLKFCYMFLSFNTSVLRCLYPCWLILLTLRGSFFSLSSFNEVNPFLCSCSFIEACCEWLRYYYGLLMDQVFLNVSLSSTLLCWRILLQAHRSNYFRAGKEEVAGMRLQLWLLSLVKWVYFYSVENLSITMTACDNSLHFLLWQWVFKFKKISFKLKIQLHRKG